MLLYILKFTLCLAALLIFYKLFLERESIHIFKRFYLLGALVFSLIVPSLVFTEYVEVETSAETTLQPIVTSSEVINVPPALQADAADIAPLLWGIYFLGVVFFGIKFLKNLFQIFRRIHGNPKLKKLPFVQVLLLQNLPPHTFFKYIFLNKTKLEANEIPKEVLLHEETHARQKHSMDILFIEFLQIIMWFNPLIYFMRKSIQLNHEFLADQAVLKKGITTSTYQNTLLSFMSPRHHQSLANAINYSSIKKRFTVMKSQTSKRSIWIKGVILIPLTTLLLLSFSVREIRYTKVAQHTSETDKTNTEFAKTPFLLEDVTFREPLGEQQEVSEAQLRKYNDLAKKYNKQPIETRSIPLIDLKTLESIYKKMSSAQKERAVAFPECPPKKKVSQDGAPRKLMAEYNKLAKHYNSMPREHMQISLKDVKRLKYIYGLMSEKQRADAEPFPDFPPMPDPPPPAVVPQLASASEVAPSEALAPSPAIASQAIKATKATLAVVPPSSPSAEVAVKPSLANVPPPPPPPPTPNPLDEVIKLTKEDAIFYYQNKKISSDKAISIIKQNNDLSISVKRKNNNPPVVKISKYL